MIISCDEIRVQRKAKLAEEIVTDFRGIPDVLRWVRSPGGFAGEADNRPWGGEEGEDTARTLAAHFGPIGRPKQCNNNFFAGCGTPPTKNCTFLAIILLYSQRVKFYCPLL